MYAEHAGFLYVFFLLGQAGAAGSILFSGRLYHRRPDRNTKWDFVLHSFVVGSFYFLAVVIPGSVLIWFMSEPWLYVGYALSLIYYIVFLRIYLGAFVRIPDMPSAEGAPS